MVRYRLERAAKGVDTVPGDSHNFLDGLRLPANVSAGLPLTIQGKPLTSYLDDRDKIESALILANKTSAYGRPHKQNQNRKTWERDPHLKALNQKLNKALALTLGISGQLTASDPVLIPGRATKFQFQITNHGSKAAIAKRFWFGERGKTSPGVLAGPEVPPNLVAGKTPLKFRLLTRLNVRPGSLFPHSRHLYDGDITGKQFEAADDDRSGGNRISARREQCG